MRCSLIMAAGLLVMVRFVAPLEAQDRLTVLSVSLGPATLMRQFYLRSIGSVAEWNPGVAASVGLSRRIAPRMAVLLEGMAFRGSVPFQVLTIGLEARLGAKRQFPISVGGGVYREPDDGVCIEGCARPAFTSTPRGTISLSAGYLARAANRFEWGPVLAITIGIKPPHPPYRSARLGFRLAYAF